MSTRTVRTVWKGGNLVNVHRTQGFEGWGFSKCPPARTVWKGGDLVNVHPYVLFGKMGI